MAAKGIEPECIARTFRVNGIVQGVGFRPFVYGLANRYRLKGEIANTSSGVCLHVEGVPADIASFGRDLVANCPPLARITDLVSSDGPLRNFRDFSIAASREQKTAETLISPDVSICADCLRELFDPADRRYRYPFINCTNCGPRYTIVDHIPYDRPNTSMRKFRMCPGCQAEYDDPNNRRFHAQPNACAACGPRVALYDRFRKRVEGAEPVEQAAALLKAGYLLAVKGLGGFHIAADAENSAAVVRLRQRKLREEKPLALMSRDLSDIAIYARIEAGEEILLRSPQRPIVLLPKRIPNPLARQVAPRNRYFGVMLPYTPLHYLILSCGFTALVMTSGNRSEEPIAIDNDDAFARLADIADYFLTHDRDIYLRSDDSIVRHTAGAARLVRRSRGYVPAPVFLKERIPPVLACGAEQKNTVCLTRGNQAFLSQHIGDLENLPAYEFFKMTIAHMQRILDIQPQILACDLHPDYLSTRYVAEQETGRKIQVQHHHAHIVSCMAENGLEGEVIGLAFDGTGYGTDGSIWGGEVLIAGPAGFRRAATLWPVPMPTGASAIKEPWKMAVGYLYDAYGEGLWNLDLPLFKAVDADRIARIVEMTVKKINAPATSSLGRLFDGIAAIAGLRTHVGFEGQAAMELEMAADKTSRKFYDFEWISDGIYKVLPAPLVRAVVRDVAAGADLAEISARFHSTLIRLFSDLCGAVRADSGLSRVALSGGVFQNAILLAGLEKALGDKGFEVYSHRQVPANDGGISLGQAVIAAAAGG
ncbi:MAG: carbamoyltransferase HypF [Thermodesulfobacteriota bacterium]